MSWKSEENLFNARRILIALLASILCVVSFFLSLKYSSLLLLSNSEEVIVHQLEQKIVEDQFSALKELSFLDLDSAVSVIASSFNDPIEILEYETPTQKVFDHVQIFLHKISLKGNYSDVIQQLYVFELSNPKIFVVNYNLKPEFTSKQNFHKTKNGNEKIMANITLVHYGI